MFCLTCREGRPGIWTLLSASPWGGNRGRGVQNLEGSAGDLGTEHGEHETAHDEGRVDYMGIREDIEREIGKRQAVEQGAGAPRAERAETARRKFDPQSSSQGAVDQFSLAHGGDTGDGDDSLYQGTHGGKSRLGSLPSSDAILEELGARWRPSPLPSVLRSSLFGTDWNMRVGGSG